MYKNILMMVLIVLLGFGIAYADMRSDATKIDKFGNVLLEVERSASRNLSRMTSLKTRLNNLRAKAVNRFGAGSLEVAEVDTVIINIDTAYIDAANAWVK